jgi:hypothetical protein
MSSALHDGHCQSLEITVDMQDEFKHHEISTGLVVEMYDMMLIPVKVR